MAETSRPRNPNTEREGAHARVQVRVIGAALPEPLWRVVLGARLRRIRHERGERLVDTADRAGVSPQYLSEVERGLKEPSSEMIAAIARAFGLTLVDLTLGVAEYLGAPAVDAPSSSGRAAPAGPAASLRAPASGLLLAS
ncbi:MAG: helix-turn-helix domain-containing protein [Actinomycetaceae bacterium]